MGPRLGVIGSKCPRLKNVYKSNGRCLKKVLSPTTKGTKEGNNRRSSVYTCVGVFYFYLFCLFVLSI